MTRALLESISLGLGALMALWSLGSMVEQRVRAGRWFA